MFTMKHLTIACTLTMAVAAAGNVFAQPAASAQTDTLRGVEISPGIVDPNKDVRFGVAFAGAAAGDLPGLVAAAVNYTPAATEPDGTNVVVGGHWALTVRRGGRFVGTLFGQITSGTIVWDGTGKLGTVAVELNVGGGTRTFAGVSGKGSFEGTLDRQPLDVRRLPKLDGVLNLTF